MKTEINTLAIYCGKKDFEAVSQILSGMGYDAPEVFNPKYTNLCPQQDGSVIMIHFHSDRTGITAEDFIQKYGKVEEVDSKQTKPFSLVTSDGVPVSDPEQEVWCVQNNSVQPRVAGYIKDDEETFSTERLAKDNLIINPKCLSMNDLGIPPEEMWPDKPDDHVNHPPHYGGSSNTYEAIKVIEAWELDFCLGNAVKYISRSGKKDTDKTVQDLEKAKWYLERKISQLKSIQKC